MLLVLVLQLLQTGGGINMPIAPIPIQHYLVPGQNPITPDGFTQVDQTIFGGLPHTIQIDEATALLVVAPNGLARTWRDIDPTSIVSKSDDERKPTISSPKEPIGFLERAPVRILVRQNGDLMASIPLVAGLRRMIPDSGRSSLGVRIELYILSWDLRAGSLRGLGDFGSRISLAWRRADKAGERFSTPPVNPKLIPRLEPKFKMESLFESKFEIVQPTLRILRR